MLSKKLIKYLTFAYILLLAFGFFYVRDIVATDRVDVDEEVVEEKVKEVKPITVYLQIDNGTEVSDYKVRMNNTNSFEDLLEYLRENDDLKYERNYYLSGTHISEINDVKADNDLKWLIYKESQDVTGMYEELELTDETSYKLVFTRSAMPQ